MNAPKQQAMFKEMGVRTFYIGESIGDPKRATVMFEGPENVLYNIFISPKTKMTLSPNEMTPYIRKIKQKFDEAQTFLEKNGFHQATKGLSQDIQDTNGIDKKNQIIYSPYDVIEDNKALESLVMVDIYIL